MVGDCGDGEFLVFLNFLSEWCFCVVSCCYETTNVTEKEKEKIKMNEFDLFSFFSFSIFGLCDEFLDNKKP